MSIAKLKAFADAILASKDKKSIKVGDYTIKFDKEFSGEKLRSEVINRQINNSHSIKYKKNNIVLENIFSQYVASTGFTPYNFTVTERFLRYVQIDTQSDPSATCFPS